MPRNRPQGYKPIHKGRQVGGASGANCVATRDLAEVLGAQIDRMNRGLAQNFDKPREKWDGAHKIIGERAAMRLGTKADSIPRRIYGIVNGESRATKATLAEAFLLAADADETKRLPEFPIGMPAAREAVDAHCFVTEEQLSLPERDRLARMLLHFGQGYIHEFHVIDQEVAAGLEALFTVGTTELVGEVVLA